MDELRINTAVMKEYAKRLSQVNVQLARLDLRLKKLYSQVKRQALWDLIRSDDLIGFSWRITKSVAYLSYTADDFEATEKRLIAEDPSTFQPKTVFRDWYHEATQFGADAVQSKNLSELINVCEGVYEKRSEALQILAIESIPGYVKDIYKIGTGIIQRDLTLEQWTDIFGEQIADKGIDPWNLIQHGNKNPKRTWAMTKALLTFEAAGSAVSEDMQTLDQKNQKKFEEQLLEWDILGAGAVGIEAFVDEVFGGAFVTCGSAAGKVVDAAISGAADNPYLKKYVKSADGIYRYVFNCSPGESVAKIGSEIQREIDAATDFVTEKVDYLTSGITQGAKNVVSWIAGKLN